jgi:FeS assembly SUF system regulator
MLKVSKLADYGTVIMARMAREPERLMSAAIIAVETGLSLPTVNKVLKLLARQTLVVTRRGKNGGYALGRPPARISLVDIIDAVEGRFGLTECASAPGLCRQEGSCAIRGHWLHVDLAVRRALEGLTLTQLAAPEHALPGVLVFHPRGSRV